MNLVIRRVEIRSKGPQLNVCPSNKEKPVLQYWHGEDDARVNNRRVRLVMKVSAK